MILVIMDIKQQIFFIKTIILEHKRNDLMAQYKNPDVFDILVTKKQYIRIYLSNYLSNIHGHDVFFCHEGG